MADIKFTCPHCPQPLEAPSDMEGETINCPSCLKQLVIPHIQRVAPPAPARKPIQPLAQISRPKDSTPRPTQQRKSPKGKIILLLIVLCLGYIVWPYISVWKLYGAIRAENPEAISDRIDFPSLRISLKEQMNAFVMKEMVNDKNMDDNPFAGLAAVFLPKMVESMVEAYVTPAGITQMFESGAFKAGKPSEGQKTSSEPASERLKKIKFAFFSNPAKFVIKTEDVDFVLRLRDWTWKLTEVRLAQAAMQGIGNNKKATSSSSPVPSTPKDKGWHLRTDISPIDDSKSYFLSREAEEPVGSGFMQSTPTLMIRYKEKALNVFVTVGSYLGSDATEVTVRIGQSPAREEKWSISTDGKAIFCPSEDRAFVLELLQNNRLVIRLTPYGESPVTSTFDLSGLVEAIQPMRSLIE